MAPPGPTMRRRQLGAELRRLRNDAAITMEHAAAVLDCARSRIGHIENGRNSIRKPELKVILDRYGASDDEHRTLEELRQHASKRGWSSTYRLPSWLKRYVEMETDATTMRSFEGELIPGLLQTEAYARRVHTVAGDLITPANLDKWVAARMRRQARLTDDTPLELSTVISEAAFRRALADTEIGPAQLEHVITMARRPNVTLHVLPYQAGLHASMSGSFAVLTFDTDLAPPSGYQEHAIGGHVTDDRATVSQLLDLWELLRTQALPARESLRWLSGLYDETRK
ncbi:MAG TPA: helix-turn-helix transcriptional regulator [Pseudonocardiaceae bacterium]|nr:helix-turn-helix transcriptional regulator [Pseudonocardiaceae bacterium]